MVPVKMINKGFTLIEIIIAVMLTGLLTTLALAPVAVTVRRTIETQEQYSDLSALSRTVNFITRDIFAAMRLSSNVLMIVDHKAIGGNDDDVLMVMTTSPVVQNMPSGTVVYKLEEGGMLHGDVLPGLYRWIFPGQLPNTIKYDNLSGETGQLVLPGIDEFSVEVPEGSHEDDRRKEYSGALPQGIYIKLGRNTKQNNMNMTEKKGDFNELETYIALP
ncbi:MAG: prepilin-type N-terminal cleavage/methylation domain-containing protein [Synergistaceae bacterium]|nr:prepilin-type N-terminal cleavage/methylation domain-containing protein [Synergistaceae bacterium]